MTSEEEQSWRRWWAERTPEAKAELRAMRGQPMRAAELLEDDDGLPQGVRVTGGVFSLPGYLFDEDDDDEGERDDEDN